MFPPDSFIKRLILYGTLVSCGGAVVLALVLYNIPTSTEGERPDLIGETVVSQPMTAQAWVIFDVITGEVLKGEKTDIVLPIASVTKLFTAYTVMESEHSNDAFSIRESDLYSNGRAGKLTVGEVVTPYTLLFPLLIESSNDAATAIARYLGDEYTTTLSKTLASHALISTHIDDPSGLSARNVSTPRELAQFYVMLKRTYPHLIDITRLRMYIGPRTGYVNNNPAVTLSSFRGGKHGYTDEAGRTFVGTCELGSGKEIGIVLLGSSDIVHDIEVLEKQGEVL